MESGYKFIEVNDSKMLRSLAEVLVKLDEAHYPTQDVENAVMEAIARIAERTGR